MSIELIPVRMRDCACEGTPHLDGDYAYLKPRADIEVGLAVHQVVATTVDATKMNGSSLTPEQALEAMQIKLGIVYAVHGISSWTLTDDKNQPLPINEATVRALSWTEVLPIADRAATLYAEEVLVPLVASLSKSSRSGQTKGSTSAKTRSTRARRKR